MARQRLDHEVNKFTELSHVKVDTLPGYGTLITASNETYGTNMSVDGQFTGTADNIHDGGDSAGWTASAVVGTWDFISTDQAAAGTRSIDATAVVHNDVARFERATTINSDNYVAISGQIYITRWPNTDGGLEISFYDASLNQVGETHDISDSFDKGIRNAWQPFSDFFDHFDLDNDTIKFIEIKVIHTGAGQPPAFYLDLFQVEESGGATFEINPIANSITRIRELCYYMEGNAIAALADTHIPVIDPTKFFTLGAVSNGIQIKRSLNGVNIVTGVINTFADFTNLPGAKLMTYGNGNGMVINITYDLTSAPVDLDSRNGDKLTYTVRDKMGAFGILKVITRCQVIPLS